MNVLDVSVARCSRWHRYQPAPWCLQSGSYEDLVKYLIMVRKKAKDSKVDTELVYA